MKEEQRKAVLDRLRSVFPDERDDRLVTNLLFLLSATEDLQSFGRVSQVILDPPAETEKWPAWKAGLLQEIVSSIAWVNRLTTVYAESVLLLTLRLQRQEPISKSPPPAGPTEQESLFDRVDKLVP